MLAGDLLVAEQGRPSELAPLVATGFHRNTTNNTEGGANAEEYRHASVVDRVNTTMQVWMGLTFGCAQCHNHKYDTITQREYYQVFAVFNNTEDFNSEPPTLEIAPVGRDAEVAALRAALDAAQARATELTTQVDAQQPAWEASVDRASLTRELAEVLNVSSADRTSKQKETVTTYHRASSTDLTARNAEAAEAKRKLDAVATTTLVMKEIAARPTHVAIRGDYRNQGEAVTPGVPAGLHAAPASSKFDRLAFARWLVDPANPLTARVAVNRIWQELFGVGLVETSEDFGVQGEPPSHPELLDWLATEFVRLGWDTKALVKLIVTSNTYRQSSHTSPDLLARDPTNRLLARGPRNRLSAEAVRDQALSVSGLLSDKMYGAPVHPPQPINGLAAAFGQSTDWETSKGEDRYRRALYTRWRRNLPYASMLTFDAPERTVCSSRRIRSNTPLQALVTMNDPVFVESAQALARLILRDGGSTDDARAAFALRRVLIRTPEAFEVKRLVALHEQSRSLLAADPNGAAALATKPLGASPEVNATELAAWTVVAGVLLNLDETLAKP